MERTLKSNKNRKSAKTILKKNISGWLLIAVTILLFVLVVWRPVIMAFELSFFKLKGFEAVEFVGLKNFKDVLTDTNFLRTLWNTVVYVVASIIIGFPLPFVVAVLVNEMVRTKEIFKATMYLPSIIPGIAVYLIWQNIYGEGATGLLNMLIMKLGGEPMTWLSNSKLVIPLIIIAMTWNSFGSTIILYLASLQGVNQELYEAARIDGAGIFMRTKVVLLPHMYGILLLNLIRQIIGIFQISEQPLVMTGGGPNGASMSLGLTNYFYGFKYGQFDKSMALGVVTFLLLLVFTYIYFKFDKKINS